MKTKMLTLAVSLAFIPNLSSASSLPDLCDDVHLDSAGVPIHDAKGVTLSRYCEWTGPDAPWWGASLCCSFDAAGAHCTAPSSRGCGGAYEMWCEYGEQHGDGSVTCYQPLPDACEAGYCVAAPQNPPTGEPYTAMCCGAGGCFPASAADPCDGDFVVCDWGISNADGSVECFD